MPCLLSRVSRVLRAEARLWELTTPDVLDDPSAIAGAANRLLASKDEAVQRARSWMSAFDQEAVRIWATFTGSGSV